MIKIIYKQDPLSEEKTIEQAQTIGQWLTSKYEHMPEHVRIFHNPSDMENAEISIANEVTPKNAHDLKQLDFLPGTFIVIENPKGVDPITIAWAVVISLVVGVAVAFLMPAPSVVQTNQNNNQSSSANNELSNRENKTRVNGRIADIYGAAHDTPDLIAVPYKVYENNVEVEHLVGCIGSL